MLACRGLGGYGVWVSAVRQTENRGRQEQEQGRKHRSKAAAGGAGGQGGLGMWHEGSVNW